MSQQTWSAEEIAKANQALESKDALAVLQWGAENFFPKIGFASSFGAEDVVVIDLITRVKKELTIFTLDTGRLNEETYEVMDRIREKYKISIESYFPRLEKVQALEREKGFYSFRESVENRRECCAIRKVEPLQRALKGLDAW